MWKVEHEPNCSEERRAFYGWFQPPVLEGSFKVRWQLTEDGRAILPPLNSFEGRYIPLADSFHLENPTDVVCTWCKAVAWWED